MLFQITVQAHSFFISYTNFHELDTKSKIGSAESEISTKSIFQKLQLMTIRDIFLIIRVLYNFFFESSCLIHPRRILMPLPHFIGQPLRFKHFQPCTTQKQLSLEVGGGKHEDIKVGKRNSLIYLFILSPPFSLWSNHCPSEREANTRLRANQQVKAQRFHHCRPHRQARADPQY